MFSGFQDAAVLSLEEIDGVEVRYETTESGKAVTLVKVRDESSPKSVGPSGSSILLRSSR